MGIKDWLGSKLITEKLIESRVDKEISKRVKENFNDFVDATEGFRRLSERPEKDLKPHKYEKHQALAYYLGMTNPLARRIIGYHEVFVAGGNIRIKAEDKKVQDIIDLHWKKNKWDKKKGKKISELGLYGEQCYPVFINPGNGLVKLGYVDPMNIKDVKLDKNNPEIKKSVEVKMNKQGETKEYKIIDDLDDLPKDRTVVSGEYCFFFTVNNVSNAKRGYSDLLTIEDWLDAYDQVVMNFVERSKLLQAFLWDIAIDGASDQEIQDRREKLEEHTPKAGSFVVHSSDETWSQLTPDLRARENIEEARHIKNLFIGAQAFPEFWFGEGEKTTRATALAQGTPTLKVLEARQNFFKMMIKDIIDFQIHQSRIAQKTELSEVDSFLYSIIMPELEIKDWVTLTDSFQKLTSSLVLGLDNNLVTHNKAVEVYSLFLSKFGIEVDHTIELESLRASAERDFKKIQDILRRLEAFRK